MISKKSLFIVSSAALLSSASIMAAPATHMVIAPQCLLDEAHASFKTLATDKNFRLMEVNDDGVNQLAAFKHHGKQPCGGFMDVSAAWDAQKSRHTMSTSAFLKSYTTEPSSTKTLSSKQEKYEIRYEKETQAVLKTITPQNMWDNLTTLTNFHNRYANSDTGVEAASWIKAKIEAIAKETGHDDVTVYFVKTAGYKQPSVVAKFGKGDEAGIVIGGHMDTLQTTWPAKGDSKVTPHLPGADDDGSGSVTVMETARAILASGLTFQKPIYFIWYSAEEMGLVGSQNVVADFKKNHIAVETALQMDMTGYANKNDPTLWLMTDFVSPALTSFLEKLIKTYVKQPYNFSKCGYACSDHASWNKGGVAAAFPFESAMNNDDPYIHTENDTMDVLSLDHMTDFAKLGTSYVIELAVPVTK